MSVIYEKYRNCIRKSKVKLNSHQKRVIERLFISNGLLVVHGTGSGKTLSSIGVSECLLDNNIVKHVVVCAPRVLVDNFNKELNTYGVSNNLNKYTVSTYMKTLTFLNSKDEKFISECLLIVDEAHNLRTPVTTDRETGVIKTGKIAHKYIKFAKKCKKVLLLTATPFLNRPSEINNLMQMVNKTGQHISMKKFEKLYIIAKKIVVDKPSKTQTIQYKIENFAKNMYKDTDINKQRTNFFQKKIENFAKNMYKDTDINKQRTNFFQNKIDFYNNTYSKSEFYPTVNEHHESIIMSKETLKLYTKVEQKVVENFGELEGLDLNGKVSTAYYTSIRQLSNAIPDKIDWIINKIKNNQKKNIKLLISSAFKGRGINLVTSRLNKLKIPYLSITGDTKSKDIPLILDKYNSAEFHILFISKAASEGIDLKGVRTVIILEPFWNLSDTQQVIGRAVRFKSHFHLPKNKQIVDVHHLYLVKPDQSSYSMATRFVNQIYNMVLRVKGANTPSVDTYLRRLAQYKLGIIKVFLKEMIKINTINLKSRKKTSHSKK
jgi:superfamily II DNA or RNA helicase